MSVTAYTSSNQNQQLSNGVVRLADTSLAETIPNRVLLLKVIEEATALTTGDGKGYFSIPADLSGKRIVAVGAHVYTASSSGAITVQIHSVGDAADLLSTAITIDQSEKDSSTAATPAVINTSYDDVVTGDEFRVDIDGIGTGSAGLDVWLELE